MAVTEFRDHLLRIARNEPILIHCEAAESIADCVLNLADENATLRAQLAEAVALLEKPCGNTYSTSWNRDRKLLRGGR